MQPRKAEFFAPTDTDALIGYCLGTVPRSEVPRHLGTPRDELADFFGAYLDVPWFVSFSGGCDSSLVLAMATMLSRSLGRADPIPLTLRFPKVASTDEAEWQELVVRHLDLRDWEIIDIDDELDFVGPIAAELLRDVGPLVAPTIFGKMPLLARASGGILFNGEGGDEILGPHRVTPMLDVAHGLRHGTWPSRRRLGAVARSAAPARLTRRSATAATAEWWGSWLRPDARAELLETLVDDIQRRSWSPRREQSVHLANRMHHEAMHNLDALGSLHDSRYVSPLFGARFAMSIVDRTRWKRCRGRSTILDAYFADLVPAALRRRSTKVTFNDVYFNRHTREFAERWDGSGLPDEVDAEALRSIWLDESPNGLTAMLLQRAWLHADSAARSV